MENSDSEAQRITEELAAKLARPIKQRHSVATEGSTTERGGTITVASDGGALDGKRIAVVGDRVQYPDGSETRIISGAGIAFAHNGRPVALVGSELDNGDKINGPIHDIAAVVEYEGDPIPGLFDRNYVPPQPETTLQL